MCQYTHKQKPSANGVYNNIMALINDKIIIIIYLLKIYIWAHELSNNKTKESKTCRSTKMPVYIVFHSYPW